ncbi:DUF2946 family protein [Sphingomonas sp. M6A6_1c]
MTSLRRLLLDHRTLALWLAALALAVRLLVPAGFMVGSVDGRPVLQLCSGYGPVAPMAMAMAHGGHHGSGDHRESDHPATDMPCPYAGLAQAATAPVDPVLLVLAIAFAMALGVRATRWPALRDRAHLRPPMRGPPRLS